MKKLLILLILTFANSLSAAEFVASLSTNQVSSGQSFNLTLSLSGAKAKEAPDVSVLNKDFTIYGQQQYSSYSNTNGTVTSESGWEITLVPKKDGAVLIPSLEIKTDKGKLSTQQISIAVSPSQAGGNDIAEQQNQDSLGVSLISTINTDKAYVKEPIIYTLKFISYKPTVNVVLEDIKASDAIIDKIGEPKQYIQSFGGVRAHIVEIKYNILPLIAGKLEITPAVVHGELKAPSQQTPKNSRFSMLNNFFFDNMVTFKPFVLQSDKISLNVITPPITGKNWLPLNKLELSEEWVGLAGAKVGDTIIRKVKIKAHGSFSNQLPSIKSSMDIKNIKLYTDSPVLKDDISQDNNSIIGSKEESFSIVPLQDGAIYFPPVKISWWNLRTKQAEISILPEKTLNILAAVKVATKDATIDYSRGEEKIIVKTNNWLTVLIASLVLVIFSMFAIIIYLLKNKNNKPIKAKINNNKIKPHNAIKQILTAAGLRDHILLQANQLWRAPLTLTLNRLPVFLSENNYSYDLETCVKLCKKINDALYASGSTDLGLMLEMWEQFKSSIFKSKAAEVKQADEDYINLNPT